MTKQCTNQENTDQ